MWNRPKKEEEYAPKPVSAPPTSSELAKEGIPMSTLPTRSGELHHDSSRGSSAVLGKSVIVKGEIHGREDLTIDGEVEGTVELQEHRLTIGPNGKVNATVKAREVVVLGTLHGNVETRDRVEIRKEAKLVGDIRTARIVIEDGAYFKGTIDIVRVETPRPQAVAAPKPQPVASVTVPNPSSPNAGSPNASGQPGPSVIAAGAGDIKH
jgi:cytoskeletal protein CcmA (bactofilin family)